MKKEKPLMRGTFHQAMFFISLGACIMLIANSTGSANFMPTIIYCICLLFMFGVSALYHRVNWKPNLRLMMKRLDHLGIYIMISGTLTPIAVSALKKDSALLFLIIVWTLTILGLIQICLFVNLPKILAAGIYVIMGYLILIYSSELLLKLSVGNFSLLVCGGVAYTLGALTYAFKRPDFSPQYFGYHEVFHIFVCVGAVLHFILIYNLSLFN